MDTKVEWKLAAVELHDAWTDFILSRQSMNCAQTTLAWYRHTVGAFLHWLEERGVTTPEEVSSRYVREFLAQLAGQGRADKTLHANARAIRTLLRFWYAEGYTTTLAKFDMPRMAKKRLPVLTADELKHVIDACETKRDKAIVLFMADSGLRRAEVCALNWSDVDMQSGLVTVRRDKGGKARSGVVSATTRRALLAYRRTLANFASTAPLFQSRKGRFTGNGLRLLFTRLSKQTGLRVTAHALRRTFVILSLRAGMGALHLQAMLGHSSLDMVNLYAQLVDEDLLQAHGAHSPIENL